MAGFESGETVRRGTLFSLLAEAVRVVAAAALTLVLVRVLAPHEFGILALASGIGIVVGVLSDFGTSASASRFVAERRSDPAAVAAVVRDALRIKLLISGVVALALFALAGPVADAYGEPDLVWPLRAVAAVTLTQSVFTLFASVGIGLARNALQARMYSVQSITETLSAITIVALGGGATGALLGRTAGYVLAAAVGGFVIARLVGRRIAPGRRDQGYGRRIATYAGALLVINAAWVVFDQIDVLLIGAYLGSASAGLFQAPLRVALLATIAGQAISNAVAPRVARHQEDATSIPTLLLALRLLVLLGMAITVVLMVWSRPLVDLLLGEDYRESAEVLLAVGPFIFFGFVAPLITVSANYLGHARRRMPIAVGTLALQIVLDVILIPRWGIVGPAIATSVSFGIYTILHLRLLVDVLDLDVRPLALTFGRALVAGGAFAGVLALAGTGTDLGLTSWILGLAGGLAAYAGVLLALGELRGGELRGLQAMARRRGA